MLLLILVLQTSSEGYGVFLPMLALLVVFYVFMILPQSRKRKKEKKFVDELKKGSRVVTSSGIHGKLVQINNDEGTVVLETSAGKIKFERAAISVELTKKYLTSSKK